MSTMCTKVTHSLILRPSATLQAAQQPCRKLLVCSNAQGHEICLLPGCAHSEGQSDIDSSQQTIVQALLIPLAPPAPEDIATVSSVLQRMVEVVIFRSVVFDTLTLTLLIAVALCSAVVEMILSICRAASELQPGLLEQMEAQQVSKHAYCLTPTAFTDSFAYSLMLPLLVM